MLFCIATRMGHLNVRLHVPQGLQIVNKPFECNDVARATGSPPTPPPATPRKNR
jgi:hypothetical protein